MIIGCGLIVGQWATTECLFLQKVF
jgi:hypothetical protein